MARRQMPGFTVWRTLSRSAQVGSARQILRSGTRRVMQAVRCVINYADETHLAEARLTLCVRLAFEHVPELREFIDVPLAHEGADAQAASVPFPCPLWCVFVFGIDSHAADSEWLAEPRPKLATFVKCCNLWSNVEDRATGNGSS